MTPWFQAALYLLAVANGLLADFAYGPAGSLPISPVIAIIVFVTARSIVLSAPSDSLFVKLASGFVLMAVLIPSSLASWLALFGVAATGLVTDRSKRAAHQLTIGLAATQLWKALAFKILASPLLAAEAAVLSIALHAIGLDPKINGNVISVAPDHTLVLLAGCSAFSDLGIILLGWLAVFRLVQAGTRVPSGYLALVAATAIAANIFRLILMSFDPAWHRFVHDGTGASVYDGLMCALVMSAGLVPRSAAVHQIQKPQPPIPANSASHIFHASVV